MSNSPNLKALSAYMNVTDNPLKTHTWDNHTAILNNDTTLQYVSFLNKQTNNNNNNKNLLQQNLS